MLLGNGRFFETIGVVTSKDDNRGIYEVSIKSSEGRGFIFYVEVDQYSVLSVGDKTCFRSREKPSISRLNFSSVPCRK